MPMTAATTRAAIVFMAFPFDVGGTIDAPIGFAQDVPGADAFPIKDMRNPGRANAQGVRASPWKSYTALVS
jgi:hypothetical protein